MRIAVRRLAATLLLAVATTACGDPPPDPSVAPIEIVANSRAMPRTPCILNRNSVGAGTHEIVAIAESAPAIVRLQDADGVAIYEERVEQGASKSTTVALEAGTYAVSCADVSGSPVSSVFLQVDEGND